MTVTPDMIVAMINRRINKILTIAEVGLPPERFQPFRKLVLDEMGRNGMETELHQLFDERHGSRNG